MTTCGWCGQEGAEYRIERFYILPLGVPIWMGNKNRFKICEGCVRPISKAWIDRRHSVDIRALTLKERMP